MKPARWLLIGVITAAIVAAVWVAMRRATPPEITVSGNLSPADIAEICAEVAKNPEANSKPIVSVHRLEEGDVEVTTRINEGGFGTGEYVMLQNENGKWRVVSVDDWKE